MEASDASDKFGPVLRRRRRDFLFKAGFGEHVLDEDDVAERRVMAGVGAMAADFAPARGLAEAQAVAIVGQDAADQFAVAEARGVVLHGAHQLASYAVAAELAADEDENFADVVEREARIVLFDGGPACDPVADFGDEQWMLGVLFGGGDAIALLFDRARFVVEGGHAVGHGVVEDFAQRGGVFRAREANCETRAAFGCSHLEILAEEKWPAFAKATARKVRSA